jgi:putative toxin-antitoxin system antitoxin component (TIGR02293 family)
MKTLEAITRDAARAERQIEAGIEWAEMEQLAAWLDLPVARLAEYLQIPAATLTRRKARGRFSVDESERIVRFARLWVLAHVATGSEAGARAWLKRPQHGLGGRVPLDAARLEIGARGVETLLQRLHYGVLA